MYNLQPTLIQITEKKLIGKKLSMTINHNKVAELWQNFMPSRKAIKNAVSTALISMSIYNENYFRNFTPSAKFEKWAAVEVDSLSAIPDGMVGFTLKPGLYAVFHYTGYSNDHRIFDYIFRNWLPTSGYELDDRPHFEILGDKFKRNSANSEEDIYIPVRHVKSDIAKT